MNKELTTASVKKETIFEDETIDRPTVQQTETHVLVPYKTPEKTVKTDDAIEAATISNPGFPAHLDDQGGGAGHSEVQAMPAAQGKAPQKTPMEFFDDFKAAFCLGEPLLFHTPEQQPMISINVNGHYENIFIESRVFDRMCHYFSIKMNKQPACSAACINKIRTTLSTIATFEGSEIPLHVRYAMLDNAIYIDLANDKWQQVQITANGWGIIENIDSPVKFIRKKGMKAMPIPDFTVDLDAFKSLINLNDEDWTLMASWILGAMNPEGPFPILILQGQKGSAKTTTAKLLKDLIDPSDANIQALPKSERDLVIAANNSWVLNFDNLSGVSVGMADAFCRIATGSGFRTRKLFTDDDESLFNIKRPVIMNGITDISRRSDFMDRAIVINMPVISEAGRLPESTMKNYWKDCKPSVFGYLCHALCLALSNRERIIFNRLPRMADFAQWVTAGEAALGWEQGAFLTAYENARIYLTETTLEADPVGSAVIRLMETYGDKGWSGSATQLLEALEVYADARTIKSKDWPKAANVLSNQLRRSSADLLTKGIAIEWGKSGQRFITIQRIGLDFTSCKGNSYDNIEAMAWESGAI